MKIVFDYEIFTKQKYGGISNYFCCLANEIIIKKKQIKIISPLHKNFYLENFNKEHKSAYHFSFPQKIINPIEKFNHYLTNRIIKKINPDIIHNTYYFKKQIKTVKAKNVLTFMDLSHELYDLKSKKNIKIAEWKKECAKSSDHIIVPSNTTKLDLMDIHKIDEKKITITHLSSDFKTEYVKNFSDKKMNNYILFVGGRSGYKNFENFIYAYSESKKLRNEYKILIFGGEKKTVCGIDILKKYNIPNKNFTFIYGDEDKLKFLYKNVACLIFPSFYEGFGLPVIEAMRSGCPLILSNAKAFKEVAGNGLDFFDPSEVDDIKEKLETLLFSESKLKENILYGLSRANNFSWKKCAQETINAYSKIL
mgnify:CR=1 FL=1